MPQDPTGAASPGEHASSMSSRHLKVAKTVQGSPKLVTVLMVIIGSSERHKTTIGLGYCIALSLPPLPPRSSLSNPASLIPTHFFSPVANWVVPGHVLQGRHPGSGRGSTKERVRSILEDGGVDTFVCLQAELPPSALGSAVTTLGGSEIWKTNPMPGFESYVEDTAAVSVESGREPPQLLHYGIEDMNTADSLDELVSVVTNLADRVRNGEVLYLHCWGGKGRAGLVASCLLGILYQGDKGALLDAEDALERIQAYCGLRNRGIGAQIRSPETDGQKAQVHDFYNLLQTSS